MPQLFLRPCGLFSKTLCVEGFLEHFVKLFSHQNEPVYIQCLFYKNKTSHKVFRIIEMVLMEKIIQQDKLS